MSLRSIAMLTGALAFGLPVVAFAQPAQPAAQAGQASPQPKAKAKAKDKGAPRVIQIDTVTVEGEVQKPEAFYILQRSELDFRGLEPKKSFIPLILESVEKEPF